MHLRDETKAPATDPTMRDRPAGRIGVDRHPLWFGALVFGSLTIHGLVIAIGAQGPRPLPSLGIPAISIELVLGADVPAGTAPSQAQEAAPAPEGAGQPTESAEVQPPRPTDLTEAAPAEPAELQPTLFTEAPQPDPAQVQPTEQAEVQSAEPPRVEDSPPPTEQARAEAIRDPIEPEPQVPERESHAPQPAQAAEVKQTKEPEEEPAAKPATKPKLAALPPERSPDAAAPSRRVAPVATTKTNNNPRQQSRTREKKPQRAASASATGGVGRGSSSDDASYAARVAAHLARHKRFPPEARNQGGSSSAVVQFSVDGNGRVTSIRLVGRTGVTALDREAQEMVQRASPVPAPPLRQGRSFTLPVRFSAR